MRIDKAGLIVAVALWLSAPLPIRALDIFHDRTVSGSVLKVSRKARRSSISSKQATRCGSSSTFM